MAPLPRFACRVIAVSMSYVFCHTKTNDMSHIGHYKTSQQVECHSSSELLSERRTVLHAGHPLPNAESWAKVAKAQKSEESQASAISAIGWRNMEKPRDKTRASEALSPGASAIASPTPPLSQSLGSATLHLGTS